MNHALQQQQLLIRERSQHVLSFTDRLRLSRRFLLLGTQVRLRARSRDPLPIRPTSVPYRKFMPCGNGRPVSLTSAWERGRVILASPMLNLSVDLVAIRRLALSCQSSFSTILCSRFQPQTVLIPCNKSSRSYVRYVVHLLPIDRSSPQIKLDVALQRGCGFHCTVSSTLTGLPRD